MGSVYGLYVGLTRALYGKLHPCSYLFYLFIYLILALKVHKYKKLQM